MHAKREIIIVHFLLYSKSNRTTDSKWPWSYKLLFFFGSPACNRFYRFFFISKIKKKSLRVFYLFILWKKKTELNDFNSHLIFIYIQMYVRSFCLLTSYGLQYNVFIFFVFYLFYLNKYRCSLLLFFDCFGISPWSWRQAADQRKTMKLIFMATNDSFGMKLA